MLNYSKFVEEDKNILIAPAGYGKTHSIVECLKYTSGKQLILTHTHAGVASIKEKIKEAKIKNSSYHLETIMSFAQKYVGAFSTSPKIPPQDDSRNFYAFLIKEAEILIQKKQISDIIRITYSGLFVDEYQDCTLDQHKMIMTLSGYLKTHLFGDPLQGIFDFNGEMIDWDTDEKLKEFLINEYKLTEPQRWVNNGNPKLGYVIKEIRDDLDQRKVISLRKYNKIINVFICTSKDNNKPNLGYWNNIRKINKKFKESLLFIHPESESKNPRINFIKIVKYISLLESLDDKDFYNFAKEFDSAIGKHDLTAIYNFLIECFLKTEIDNWMSPAYLINKQKQIDKNAIYELKQIEEKIKTNGWSMQEIQKFLLGIRKLPNITVCLRRELFESILVALNSAALNGTTILDEMKNHRNRIRIFGRKLARKSIGTTLLTKGLEYDTVVILDAHSFNLKNFYVAITRAKKNLIIFSKTEELKFE